MALVCVRGGRGEGICGGGDMHCIALRGYLDISMRQFVFCSTGVFFFHLGCYNRIAKEEEGQRQSTHGQIVGEKGWYTIFFLLFLWGGGGLFFFLLTLFLFQFIYTRWKEKQNINSGSKRVGKQAFGFRFYLGWLTMNPEVLLAWVGGGGFFFLQFWLS